jgi:hypothetical protein
MAPSPETWALANRREPDPAHPEDLPPDHLEETDSSPADDQEYTARPKKELRPITPDQLP